MHENLPLEIQQHLPSGLECNSGAWFVLPAKHRVYPNIAELNSSLRKEDWYPKELGEIIWFGDDGTGNIIGWDDTPSIVILWNPEDGAEPWFKGTLKEVWEFILNGYQ
jgi:hypothetical protein